MRIILFGATGMVGQGVLRECLLDPDVETVLSLVRAPTAQRHAKLREIVRHDLSGLSASQDELTGYDACFFCLGVSSVGMAEPDYRRVTYDLTISAARTLASQNPAMTFIYVSGTGTDSSERGRTMWARVKGETENALLKLPFKAAYMFRPGFIRPLHGVAAKTKWLRLVYTVIGPLYPVLRALVPKYVTTTECVGRAMIHVARRGAPNRRVLRFDWSYRFRLRRARMSPAAKRLADTRPIVAGSGAFPVTSSEITPCPAKSPPTVRSENPVTVTALVPSLNCKPLVTVQGV